MLKTFEEAKEDWACKGYIAVRASEATDADREDITKVIILWA